MTALIAYFVFFAPERKKTWRPSLKAARKKKTGKTERRIMFSGVKDGFTTFTHRISISVCFPKLVCATFIIEELNIHLNLKNQERI